MMSIRDTKYKFQAVIS